MFMSLAGVAQWIGQQTEWKGCRLDSQSGHMPGLQARSPFGSVQEATNLCFSTNVCFSHTLMFLFLSRKKRKKMFMEARMSGILPPSSHGPWSPYLILIVIKKFCNM